MIKVEHKMRTIRMFYVAGMLVDIDWDDYEFSLVAVGDVRALASIVLRVVDSRVTIRKVYDSYSWLVHPIVVVEYGGLDIGLYLLWRGFERKPLFMAATPLGDVDKVVSIVDGLVGGRASYRGVMARIPRPVSSIKWKGLFEIPVVDDRGFYDRVKSMILAEVVRGDKKPKVYHIPSYDAWVAESKWNKLRAYIQATNKYVRVVVLSKRKALKAVNTISKVIHVIGSKSRVKS